MLPEPTVFVAFLAATIALILLPGPDTFYIAARSLHQGRLAGVIAALGISCGLLVHVTAAALGISSLLAYAPIAFEVIRYAGAAYLLYLAWTTVTAGDVAAASVAEAMPLDRWRIWRQAALTNLLNPKIIMFFLAFLPQFAQPSAGPVWLQMASLGAVFIALGFSYSIAVALIAAGIGRRLRRYPSFRRTQRWLTGTTLGGLALWLAATDRR
jgi:threonine/homoserine/homoserine lactone efflux protein